MNIAFGVFTAVATGIHDKLGLVISILSGLVQLALNIMSCAAASRRLHDTNRSGWWQLIGFTVIGLIPLLIWLVKEGEQGPNRYGLPAK